MTFQSAATTPLNGTEQDKPQGPRWAYNPHNWHAFETSHYNALFGLPGLDYQCFSALDSSLLLGLRHMFDENQRQHLVNGGANRTTGYPVVVGNVPNFVTNEQLAVAVNWVLAPEERCAYQLDPYGAPLQPSNRVYHVCGKDVGLQGQRKVWVSSEDNRQYLIQCGNKMLLFEQFGFFFAATEDGTQNIEQHDLEVARSAFRKDPMIERGLLSSSSVKFERPRGKPGFSHARE